MSWENLSNKSKNHWIKIQITLQIDNCNDINIYNELKSQSKIYSIVYIIDIKALWVI